MINFHYEMEFVLENETLFADWVNRVVSSENGIVNQIDYVFCNDEYLLEVNRSYLDHDAYTDIISFDYSNGKLVAGDIFISIERIKENAIIYKSGMQEELLRVMAHGILHFLGYKDKSNAESDIMRTKENEKIKMFHVEQ